MSGTVIRHATEADVPAITAIYNHYVRETAITFDLEPCSLENRRQWFSQFGEDGPHRILVTLEEDAVVAYACSTPFRPKAAYDSTVEVTIYVRPENHGHGIGRALYAELLDRLADAKVHRAIAVITLPNDGSVAIHETFGFVHRGALTEVGFKFDKYWDVAFFEKSMTS